MRPVKSELRTLGCLDRHPTVVGKTVTPVTPAPRIGCQFPAAAPGIGYAALVAASWLMSKPTTTRVPTAENKVEGDNYQPIEAVLERGQSRSEVITDDRGRPVIRVFYYRVSTGRQGASGRFRVLAPQRGLRCMGQAVDHARHTKKPRRSGAEVCNEWRRVPAATRESRPIIRRTPEPGWRCRPPDTRPAHRPRRPRLPSRCARRDCVALPPPPPDSHDRRPDEDPATKPSWRR
jgi:hypothetical protein